MCEDMPVGAYEPRWFMHSVHMNPLDEALRARGVSATRFRAIGLGESVRLDPGVGPQGSTPGSARACQDYA